MRVILSSHPNDHLDASCIVFTVPGAKLTFDVGERVAKLSYARELGIQGANVVVDELGMTGGFSTLTLPRAILSRESVVKNEKHPSGLLMYEFKYPSKAESFTL